MKKFKLKKSINEEILQPIVKVTQNENKEDKHYFNQAKFGLINYLKSEAKDGKISLLTSVKALQIRTINSKESLVLAL